MQTAEKEIFNIKSDTVSEKINIINLFFLVLFLLEGNEWYKTLKKKKFLQDIEEKKSLLFHFYYNFNSCRPVPNKILQLIIGFNNKSSALELFEIFS